jgi:hypothetical protein
MQSIREKQYMTTVAIPSWNVLGLLPPIDSNIPTSPDRSPYRVSLKDVVMRFATTPERRNVLSGFLKYRQALHRSGFKSGFQWLNGSFTENVEMIEKRPPRDVDVVTFLHTPEHFVLSDTNKEIFDNDHAKSFFSVDAYIVELDELSSDQIVIHSAYWYSMWSHRRNQAWKGFLQIELEPAEDIEAIAWLEQFETTGAKL